MRSILDFVSFAVYTRLIDGQSLDVENSAHAYCGLDPDGKSVPAKLNAAFELTMQSSLLPPEKDEFCFYVQISGFRPTGELKIALERFTKKRIRYSNPDMMIDSISCVIHRRNEGPESEHSYRSFLVPVYALISLMPCPTLETNLLKCPKDNTLNQIDALLKTALSPPENPNTPREERETAILSAYRMGMSLVDTVNILELSDFVTDTCVLGQPSHVFRFGDNWILRRAFIYAVTAFQEKPGYDSKTCGPSREAINKLYWIDKSKSDEPDNLLYQLSAINHLDQAYELITGHALPSLGGNHQFIVPSL
jgi:hypothetical protein